MEEKKKNKKREKWLKFRHRIVRNILFPTLGVFARLRYRIHIERFREQEKRPYLILYNHQTAFDQFFVGMAFRGPVYYLTSEDIFSMGWLSSLINWLVAPIPIKKQTTDVRAIMNCLRVAREGGTIAIAPEGNRTYSGKTEYMSPSIAPLARRMKLPIALYRLEGGYGVHPRWSEVVRRGKMRGYVSRVISPEEYATLTDDELFALIRDGLFVNEAAADGEFHHKKSAEYLERALYTCPFCGLTTLESNGDLITCKTCGRQVRYLPTKELRGVGFEFPYRFVSEWYDSQAELVRSLDLTAHLSAPLYRDTVELFEVIPYERKVPLCEAAHFALFGDRIEVTRDGETTALPFKEIASVAVLGKNKLNVYHNDKIYQLKGNKRFNALKYVHIYHHGLNLLKGEDAKKEFLGI